MALIRHARSIDKPRCLEMGRRFLASTPYGDLIQPAPGRLEGMFDLAFEQGCIVVADVDLLLVGMLVAVVWPHPFTGETVGDELVWWVEPEHRAGRIGPNLLRAFERWARREGVNSLKMVAPAGFPDTGKYLERRGYAPVESVYQMRL